MILYGDLKTGDKLVSVHPASDATAVVEYASERAVLLVYGNGAVVYSQPSQCVVGWKLVPKAPETFGDLRVGDRVVRDALPPDRVVYVGKEEVALVCESADCIVVRDRNHRLGAADFGVLPPEGEE